MRGRNITSAILDEMTTATEVAREGTTLTEGHINSAIEAMQRQAQYMGTTWGNSVTWTPLPTDSDGFIPSNRYSYSNLIPKQKWLMDQISQGNIKELEGMAIKIVCDEGGSPIMSSQRGNILNIDTRIPNDPRITVILQNDQTYTALIYQVEPTRSVTSTKLSPAELRRQTTEQQEKFKKQIVEFYDRQTNRVWTEANNNLLFLESDLKSTKERVDYLKNELAKAKDKAKSITKQEVRWDYIETLLTEIKQNKKVDEAYISTGFNIVVTTIPLVAVNNQTGKNIASKVFGRFAFKISLNDGISEIRAVNLDYAAFREAGQAADHRRDGGYFHPNIDCTSICWGENEVEIRALRQKMHFYGLIDFMIMFFSLYPHDSGRPYMDLDEWFAVRDQIKPSDKLALSYIDQVMEEPLIQL